MTARISIVAPMVDEAAELPRFAGMIARLSPPPFETILVDGGSADGSVAVARAQGLRVIASDRKGRAAQINAGAAAAAGDILFIIHLDTEVPADACAVVAQTLADPRVALAGFTPVIAGAGGVRPVSTFHNWIKTWYAPLIFRPLSFARGLRLLFGDHAMFFRKADFERIGGLDPRMMIMEDAYLCEKLAPVGRVRLLKRTVITSDRRIAAWGPLRANWIYFKVGLLWTLGLHRAADARYPDVR
ncbi:MAG: glycosyltransferase [Parvularculaceae bacterium]|nr:glycosyltransferase [Parvularculaceae bacterium]